MPEDVLSSIFAGHERVPAVESAVCAMLTGTPGVLPDDRSIPASVLVRVCLTAAAGRVQPAGRVCLRGGRVDGSLDLTGFRLDFGLRFEGVEFGHVVMTDLRVLALEIEGGSAAGITAGRLEVAHDLVVGNDFTSGRVWLPSASIGGDMNFGGAKLVRAEDGDASLLFDGARVGNRVYLRRGFEANHGVYGRNSRVAGGILCTSGRFRDTLDLTRAQVQGALRLTEATVDGELKLIGTYVSADLSLKNTVLNGSHARLTRVRVDGSFTWKIQRETTAPLVVGLEQAQVRFLDDDLASWNHTMLRLHGFSFGGVAVSAEEREWVEQRIAWLDRQCPSWSAHPYDELRRALQESGHEGAARDIAIARETRRRTRGQPSSLQHAWSLLYGATVAHGYRPARFFLVAVLVVVGFLVYFQTLDACDPSATAKTCADFAVPAASAPPYRPFQFSLDAFVPVDLDQTSAWRPTADVAAYLVTLEIILGWLFTGVLVGAVTGVLRRD